MQQPKSNSPKLDFRQFRLMLALGVFCMLVGGAMLWFTDAPADWKNPQPGWTHIEGHLLETGIRLAGGTGAKYEMIARYEYKLDERIYHGSKIAGSHANNSPEDVRALIVPLAPEAAEFGLQDLSDLNPQRTWSVAYRPVTVRYDPQDPARAELVLEHSLKKGSAVDWIVRIVAAMFLLTAAALFIGAFPVSRRAAAPF
jgi:hypothetical protein